MSKEIKNSGISLEFYHKLNRSGGLIIVKNEQTAYNICKDICFFDPDIKDRVIYIPDSETLPFDIQPSPSSIISKRMSSIEKLVNGNQSGKIVVCCVPSLMRVISEPKMLIQKMILKLGDKIDIEKLSDFFSSANYKYTATIKNPGDWSHRGKVVDIYPVGWSFLNSELYETPVRLHLDSAFCIKTITKLNTISQESSGRSLEILVLYRNQDFVITDQLIKGMRSEAFDFHPDPRSVESYLDFSSAEHATDLSSWIRVNGNQWSSIIHLTKSDHLILSDQAKEAIFHQWDTVLQRHDDVSKDTSRIIPPPNYSWLTPDEISLILDKKDIVSPESEFHALSVIRKNNLSETLNEIKKIVSKRGKTLFIVSSETREKHLSLLISMIGEKLQSVALFSDFMKADSGVFLTRGDLSSGFESHDGFIRVITEQEIFNEALEAEFEKDLGELQKKAILQGLGSIKRDDPIVHAFMGIGRFYGFESIDLGAGHSEDMLRIRYADDAYSFVPVSDLDLVSRYSGTDIEKAPLTKLNDKAWLKGLREAQESCLQTAKDLIQAREKRRKSIGITMGEASEDYANFCELFRYPETPDQKRAIIEIEQDLTSGKPMDRLVCGDVGFGKTEVAMRAAFLVADKGFQVAFLAPTTLLAEQHYHSVIKRFEETGIKAVLMSSGSNQKSDMEKISSGKASIVIGTHRLLQPDMKFKNLGLIIIDEEHRFGVQQKELLHKMKGNKHTLSLAATPIPRTLSLAMTGIRDISIMATPPSRRLSIRTLVRENNDSVIREAISREVNRGGQVFFLHNRIETIDACVDRIQAIAPNARIGVLHGKQKPSLMGEVMSAFRHHDYDILITTTVIEVGIDIPNANTLIIENAGSLGLAQLHQLRGRVGRSDKQAYSYLLTGKKESPIAKRRLRAMEEASSLGEGALIARQDMEIRGVGEILGEEQSGHIYSIGFTLYMRLLSHAIKAMDKGVDNESLTVLMNKVNIPVKGYLPESFISDAGERLKWYQRLMSSESKSELDQIILALNDFYGYLPDGLITLRQDVINHIVSRDLGISSVKSSSEDVLIKAYHYSNEDKLGYILKKAFPKRFSFDGNQAYRIKEITLDEVMLKISKLVDI